MNEIHAPIVKRIARYLKRSGLTKTAFGKAVCNNGFLVQRIERGNVRSDTLQKVLNHLKENGA